MNVATVNKIDPQVERLASLLYDAVGSPVSTRLKQALLKGDYGVLAKTRIDPREYYDSHSFHRDYAAVELLRKYPGMDTGIDRAQVAKDNFWASEKKCYQTNERLYPYVFDTDGADLGVSAVIQQARKVVRELIGMAPPKDWFLKADFGPGATYHDRGSLILLPDKLCSRPSVTRPLFYDNAWVFLDWLSTEWCQIANGKFQCVEGNRFTTVPKSSETDRGICIEPSVNLFYQKAIGSVLKSLLKKGGLDLIGGQEKNGTMAWWASLTGQYATIDLSSASDTVSRHLVRLLLPEAWYTLLDNLRSPSTEIDGKRVKLEKFSSMGNGFTFELETLCFAAICGALRNLKGQPTGFGTSVFVYGDDIIVQTNESVDVLSALRFFGFTPNPRKTFLNGPFRESCGHDYFGGYETNVFRLEDLIEGPESWFSIANGLRRCYRRANGSWLIKSNTWRYALSQIPAQLRNCRGPSRLGDIVIHDEPDTWRVRQGIPAKRPYKPKEKCLDFGPPKPVRAGDVRLKLNKFENPGTAWVRAYAPVSTPVKWGHWPEGVQLVTRTFRPGDYHDGFTGRGCTEGYTFRWVSVS